MFTNIFNEKAIKELASILAKQETERMKKKVLLDMEAASIGLSEKLKIALDEILN